VSQPPLEECLLGSGHLLSLYALLLKRLPACRDIREEASVLCNLVDWLMIIKPVCVRAVYVLHTVFSYHQYYLKVICNLNLPHFDFFVVLKKLNSVKV
jgi:hypothetical protein